MITFETVEHIPSRTYYQIRKSLNKVIKLYGRGGFIRRWIKYWEIEVNIAAEREHLVDLERTIKTVKEHGRVIINAIP